MPSQHNKRPILVLDDEVPNYTTKHPRSRPSHTERRRKAFKTMRSSDRDAKQFFTSKEESGFDDPRAFEDFTRSIEELTGIDCTKNDTVLRCIKNVFFLANEDRCFPRKNTMYVLFKYLPEVPTAWNRALFDFMYTLSNIDERFFSYWREVLIDQSRYAWHVMHDSYLRMRDSRIYKSDFYEIAFLYYCDKHLAPKYFSIMNAFDRKHAFLLLLRLRNLYPPLPFDEDFLGYRDGGYFTIEKALSRKKIPLKTVMKDYEEIARRGELGTYDFLETPGSLSWCAAYLCRIFTLGYWRSLTIDIVAKCLRVIEFYEQRGHQPCKYPRRFRVKGYRDFTFFLKHIRPILREIAILAELCLVRGISPYVRQLAVIMYTESCLSLERSGFR